MRLCFGFVSFFFVAQKRFLRLLNSQINNGQDSLFQPKSEQFHHLSPHSMSIADNKKMCAFFFLLILSSIIFFIWIHWTVSYGQHCFLFLTFYRTVFLFVLRFLTGKKRLWIHSLIVASAVDRESIVKT